MKYGIRNIHNLNNKKKFWELDSKGNRLTTLDDTTTTSSTNTQHNDINVNTRDIRHDKFNNENSCNNHNGNTSDIENDNDSKQIITIY